MMVDNPIYMARLSILADAVHDYAAKLAVSISGVAPHFAPPSALTIEEIEGLVKAHGDTAGMLKGAGVDAIELNGHLGITLLDQFVTARSNARTDKYGGDLEGRLRFAVEVLDTIRSTTGADFPIIYKYGLKHCVDGGRAAGLECGYGGHG